MVWELYILKAQLKMVAIKKRELELSGMVVSGVTIGGMRLGTTLYLRAAFGGPTVWK